MNRIIKNIFKQSNLYAGVVPLQILGIYSIVHLFTGVVASWWLIATLIGFILIAFLGVAAGYHRYCSHRNFRVGPIAKTFMFWCGVLSAQGSPIFWATLHKGYHHRYSDKEKDPHSPNDGFWHSYIWWMFKLDEKDYTDTWTSVLHLLKDKIALFFHKHYLAILWISNIVFALISVDLWLYAIILPSFLTFHQYSLQTSVTHYRKLGYINKDVGDNSVNIIWLWPLTFGEAWHNNHHSDPKNPNFRKRWWELDPTFWIIKLIRID